MTELRIVEHGGGSAEALERAPLVLLHGFTQTHASWLPLAHRWSAERRVLLVDLPGHGDSSAIETDLVETAARLVSAIGERTSIPPVWVGYSLGGRVALHVVTMFADLVAGLVTIGATAGLEVASERVARRASDAALVERLRDVGVERFVEEWLSGPLFADLSPTVDDLAARRSNTSAGLASSLLRCGTGSQEPLWDRLGECDAPALFLAGDRDTKFAALADRLAAAYGGAGLAKAVRVSDAGHAAHLEQPDAVDAEVQRFLTWLGR